MAFRIRTVKGEQVRDNGTQTIRWDTSRAEWVVYCRERRRHFRGFLSVGNAADFCEGKSRRAILVSCAATKLDRPAPAADLYTSPLFSKARSYAEASDHPWFILSARHGLVEPGTVLEPYDLKLTDLTPEARDAWAGRMARALFLRGFGGWGVFEVHAGDGYTLEQVLGWDDEDWELQHDFIQWLFATDETSMFNADAPVLDTATIATFRADPLLRHRLRRSFDRWLAFCGVVRTEGSLAFENPNPRVWSRQNHNWLRITRVLRSLNLLGLPDEARAFFVLLTSIRSRIDVMTWRYWEKAARHES